MSNDEDQPSGPPSLGFGFGGLPTGDFAPTPPSLDHIASLVDLGQATANQLKQTILQAVVQSVVEPVVERDMLARQIGEHIMGQIQQANSTLEDLQHTIAQQLVGHVSGALEIASPLGVTAAIGGDHCVMPTCVQIRQEADRNQYTTALEYYRCHGWPHRLVKDAQYTDTISYVEKCLAGLPDAFTTFLNMVQQINLMPSVPGLTPPKILGTQQVSITGPSGGISDISDVIPPNPFQLGSPSPSDIAFAVANPAEAGISQQKLDTILAAHGVDDTTRASILSHITPYTSALPPGQTGGPRVPFIPLPPGVGIPPQGGGGSVSQPTCPPGTFWNPQTARCSDGSMPLCPDGMSYDPATGLCYGTPTGSGGIGGGITQPVGSGGGGGGSGPCPAPCPPPPINITVQPCKTTEPPPPPKKPPKKEECQKPQICVYQDQSSGVCYVVAGSDQYPPQPNNYGDRQLYCGDPGGIPLAELCSICGQSSTSQEQPPQESFVAGQFTGGCAEFGPVPILQNLQGLISIAQFLGIQNEDGTPALPFPNAGVTDIVQNALNAFVSWASGTTGTFLNAVDTVLSGASCGGPQMIQLLQTSALLQMVGKYASGDTLESMEIPNRQQRRFQCPVELPDQSSTVEAWLSNEINTNTAECWIRAANYRFPEWSAVARARRSKLSPLQWGTLLLREKIDQPTYNQRIRELGYIYDYEPQAFSDLLQQVPPPSDIIRMMVRDSEDTVNIDWSQEDAQFPQKYSGQLEKWGNWQGIPKQYMQYLWRAHYSIPSPGQLYEMLHRLSRLQNNDPNFVDATVVRNALMQQDISPKWVDKLMSISYRVIPLRQAALAQQTGSLTKQRYTDILLDLGYTADDAAILVDSGDKRRTQMLIRRPEVRRYAAGEMTRSDLDNTLRFYGANDDDIANAINYADLLRASATRKACVAAYRKRFLTGDIDRSTAISLLTGRGVEDGAANVIVDGWACVADARGREITAAGVNALYADGLIDEGQYIARLRRLSFDSDDAIILLRHQQNILGIKATKAQIAAQKEAQRQQDKLQRQLQRDASRLAAAERRAIAAANKARSIKQLREKRLIEAGEKYSQLLGIPLPEAILYIRSYYNTIVNTMTVTQDEAIAALLIVAGDKGILSQADFQAGVAAALSVQVPAG